MVTTLIAAVLLFSAGAAAAGLGLARNKQMARVIARGSMLVTGEGSIVIDEVLPTSKALLQDPDTYVSVQFDPTEPHRPRAPAGCQTRLTGSCSSSTSMTFT